MRVGESNPLWKSPVNPLLKMQMQLFHAYLYFYIFINHLYWVEHIATYGLHAWSFFEIRRQGTGIWRAQASGSGITEDRGRPRKSENLLPSLGEGKDWDGIEDREITEHHAIMDNLSLSVAFFPLCLFLVLEIPDRSRMCYSHVVLAKKVHRPKVIRKTNTKRRSVMGGDMGCGCRGLCRGDDNI